MDLGELVRILFDLIEEHLSSEQIPNAGCYSFDQEKREAVWPLDRLELVESYVLVDLALSPLHVLAEVLFKDGVLLKNI